MVSRGAMNNALLGALLNDRLTALKGEPGQWQARIDDWTLYVFADEDHDRVRIMVPVAEIGPRDVELLMVALSANFDRALDAKYAMKDGILWARPGEEGQPGVNVFTSSEFEIGGLQPLAGRI